jgi:hypothetical protein
MMNLAPLLGLVQTTHRRHPNGHGIKYQPSSRDGNANAEIVPTECDFMMLAANELDGIVDRMGVVYRNSHELGIPAVSIPSRRSEFGTNVFVRFAKATWLTLGQFDSESRCN